MDIVSVNKSIHIFCFADSYRIIHQALSLAQGVAKEKYQI